ncbi:AAA family ATPase [Mycolicibacterium sp. OfavD-34-C]|uniref:AAA family ATPase n=1 Tax=Mycolicibacterium sp. OfavD-34-C TaxID=2917746 RepID=UPI001EF47226|nr:AAA family ATPase [Mycolicibacterium sp. OfavD-34-C]MCG7583674.1 helicase RepA family protein [Mycolicibacterium sp. OfavD-34-C]
MSRKLLGVLHDGREVYDNSPRPLVAALELGHGTLCGTNGSDPYAEVPPPVELPDAAAQDDNELPAGTGSERTTANGQQSDSLLTELVSAAQLDTMTFPPLVEHVPHLVVEGFGILAGPPKAGKSWLAGEIALGCAQGGTVLGGIDVQGRHVLLLALEDGPRRLQSRMRRLNHGQPLPARLHILTKVKPHTVISTITEWLKLHSGDENGPLVILDTLGKARPQRRAGDDPYIADYQLGGSLKAVIDAVPGAALLVVHHTRKMKADDWLDTLSGTQGIAGSADYVLVLSRKRKSAEGVLAVTGRDIAENEYAVKTDDGIWSLDGMDILDAAATVATRADRDQQSRLGNRSMDTLRFVDARPVTTPAELAQHLGIDARVAGNTLNTLSKSGYVTKLGRGQYAPLRSESGESSENAVQASFSTAVPSSESSESGETASPDVSPLSLLSPVDEDNDSTVPSAFSPLSPLSPPGGVTASTPGVTSRVHAALQHAQAESSCADEQERVSRLVGTMDTEETR